MYPRCVLPFSWVHWRGKFFFCSHGCCPIEMKSLEGSVHTCVPYHVTSMAGQWSITCLHCSLLVAFLREIQFGVYVLYIYIYIIAHEVLHTDLPPEPRFVKAGAYCSLHQFGSHVSMKDSTSQFYFVFFIIEQSLPGTNM